MSSHRPHRTLRLHHALIALSLIAALSACTARHDKTPGAEPAPEPAPPPPAKVADPMASFARLASDEWRVTVQSGTSMFHTWHWGPGKHSIRRMTDGSGAAGEPWRALTVLYWHPGRKQVCLLGVEPVARGVAEGTIKFEGDTADGVFDLYQAGGLRKLALRWAFDGPDKYRDTLLEATGPAGYKPLVEWDHVRSKPPATPRPRTVEGEKPSKHLMALEPLLGRTWEAKGEWAAGGAFHIQTTFEWVPLADALYARVLTPSKDGEPGHLLDAYFYHHTGTGALRCLALSDRGGVYEGDLTALDGGALQIDLKGYEGDRVIPHVVRLDFEKDGTLRHRVWSLNGTERALLLDGGLHFKGQVSQAGLSADLDTPIDLGKGGIVSAVPKRPPNAVGFDELFSVVFTLSHAYEYVLLSSGQKSEGDQMIVVPGPKPKEQTPSRWFSSGLKMKNDPTSEQETWVLFRSKQLNDGDRIWIGQIEQNGNTFTVTMHRANWEGKLAKNITFHEVHGVNLGKLPAGDYTVKWIVRESSFAEFGKDGWPPKDRKPAQPAELKTSFPVRAKPEPPRK